MTEKDEAELKAWYFDNAKTVSDMDGAAFLAINYRQMESFITRKQQELVESILAEIPDAFIEKPDGVIEYTKEIKQLIREKYGKHSLT